MLCSVCYVKHGPGLRGPSRRRGLGDMSWPAWVGQRTLGNEIDLDCLHGKQLTPAVGLGLLGMTLEKGWAHRGSVCSGYGRWLGLSRKDEAEIEMDGFNNAF